MSLILILIIALFWIAATVNARRRRNALLTSIEKMLPDANDLRKSVVAIRSRVAAPTMDTRNIPRDLIVRGYVKIDASEHERLSLESCLIKVGDQTLYTKQRIVTLLDPASGKCMVYTPGQIALITTNVDLSTDDFLDVIEAKQSVSGLAQITSPTYRNS